MIANIKSKFIYKLILLLIAIIATVFSIIDYVYFETPFLYYYDTWSTWLLSFSILLSFIEISYLFFLHIDKGFNKDFHLFRFMSFIMIIPSMVLTIKYSYYSFGSIIRNIILPIAFIIDSILFESRRKIRISYIFLSLIFPILFWVLYFLIVYSHKATLEGGVIPEGEWVTYYPYQMFNLDNGVNFTDVLLKLLLILGVLFIISIILYLIDKITYDNKKLSFNFKINEEYNNDYCHKLKQKRENKGV